jgi:CheY-like chemotaxis protein
MNEAPVRKNRILVVDDEPEIVDLLKSFLSGKGYEVNGALNAEEAFGILDKKNTDLILLDIKMPGIQGTEVAKIAKEKYPFIKIIMVTGYADQAEDLLKNNILSGLFIKPIQLQQLYKKMVSMFNQQMQPGLDIRLQQGISARVLLIKARLLFFEPIHEIYGFLSEYLKKLSSRGEDYELDVVSNKDGLKAKVALFNPDILVINAAALRSETINLNAEILEQNLGVKEIILYNIEELKRLQHSELERFIKSVENVCLRNGLIEIKWVKI